MREFLCTTLYRLDFFSAFETAPSDLERLPRLFFFQMQNPPANALVLFPARQPGGNFFKFFTFPPPRTTSSDSSAAIRRATTSLTVCSHFFCPRRLRPETPI